MEQHALAAEAGLPGVHIVEPLSHALPGLSPDWRLHRNRNLVQLTSLARTVVRMGKFAPFINVVLHCGVAFGIP